MSILPRRKTDCDNHNWTTTVNSGLRRSICGACGTITLEPVNQDLAISETLQKAAASAR